MTHTAPDAPGHAPMLVREQRTAPAVSFSARPTQPDSFKKVAMSDLSRPARDAHHGPPGKSGAALHTAFGTRVHG